MTLLRLKAIIIVQCAFAYIIGFFTVMNAILPDISKIKTRVTIKVYNGKTFTNRAVSPYSKNFVRSVELPKYVTGAIIAAEDGSFFRHKGINIDETLRAARYDLLHLKLKYGGSTITQQLVKNAYLTKEKTIKRKLIEAITAVRVENKLTKRQILDYYINIAEFGKGIYGIRQASKVYFDKYPHELTPKEAAILAVVIPQPKARGKELLTKQKEEFQKRRVARIIARMKLRGYIKDSGA
ncbi:MAG: transglycosylase domain-containing protein [Candidatus Goldbacteria bacterium]|nr:transglycosylase domain-containing protein [Candidatus Goldiibacteriota bacterium]